MYSVKNVLIEILQHLQENTCARVTLLKKRLWQMYFPANFAKPLRTPFYRILPVAPSGPDVIFHISGIV